MKYNKEEFSKEFDSIFEPDSFAWNPRKYKWIKKEDEDIVFDPELSPEELIKKERIEQEMIKSWGKLKEDVFKCMDIYISKDDTAFLKEFINVAKSFNNLWEFMPFDWNTQSLIIDLFWDLDQERIEKLEPQLLFILYSYNNSRDMAQEDFLVGIIEYDIVRNDIDLNFPYPEYYYYEVKKLFDLADRLEEGEYSARLSNKFFHLVND